MDIYEVNTTEADIGADKLCRPGEPCSINAALYSAYLCREYEDGNSVISLQAGATYTWESDYSFVAGGVAERMERNQKDRVGCVTLTRIASNVVIEGNGATIIVPSDRRSSLACRLFHVLESGTLTLRNLTIRGAFADGGRSTPDQHKLGSAVFNEGELNLDNVTIEEARSNPIYTENADLTITGSTFSSNRMAILARNSRVNINDNTAFNENTESIHFDHGNNADISNVTFTRNIGDVSCIRIDESNTVNIESSQFDNNGRNAAGRETSNQSTLYISENRIEAPVVTIENSTFSNNYGTNSGGIYMIGGELTISNSTLANNKGGVGAIRAAEVGSGAYSLIITNVSIHNNITQTGVGIGGLGLARNVGASITNSVFSNNRPANLGFTDLAMVRLNGISMSTDASCPGCTEISDPGFIGGLRDNGGPTHTLLPGSGSPLVDSGSAPGGTTSQDQRYLTRPIGRLDVGAVERQPADPER